MKNLPTLVTYKRAPKTAIDYIFQIKNLSTNKTISLNSSNPSSMLYDWIPGTKVQIEMQYELDVNSIRESCSLLATDQLFLLLVLSHQGTRRSEKFFIEVADEDSNQPKLVDIVASPQLFSQKFFLELMLVVDPDLTLKRDVFSASGEMTILWDQLVGIELERFSALGDVRSENLNGALWRFDFDVPSDSASWSQLEWNSCVSVVIDRDRRDLIIDSIELKTIMFSELLMFLFAKIFETDDGLEKVLFAEKPSTFVSECRKHLLNSFEGQHLSVDSLKLKWRNDSQNIFQELQRNALRVLKNRAASE